MADARLRELEHLAAQGDPSARERLLAEKLRSGALTREDLVATIARDPQDDLPRKIMAQWLSDQRDPRGAYISDAVALASGEVYLSQRADVQQRLRTTETQHSADWLEDLGLGRARVTWNRGFIRSVQLPAATFLKVGEDLLNREPVELVRLTGAQPATVRALAQAPWALRLQGLAMFGNLDADALTDLAASPNLANLRRLNLYGCSLTGEDLAPFASAQHLEHLRMLSLTANELGDEGITHLLRAPFLATLEELYLARCEIGNAGIQALAAAPDFARLRRLGLDANDFDATGATALASSPHFPALRHLEVRNMWLGNARSALTQRFPTVRL